MLENYTINDFNSKIMIKCNLWSLSKPVAQK